MNIIISIILLSLCFISVPIIAATIGGWYAYWGALIISIIWTIILLILRIKYWEEE
jgi:hypothetical protein